MSEFRYCNKIVIGHFFAHIIHQNKFSVQLSSSSETYVMSISYSASSLYTFCASTTIIWSTRNCNYSLWYCAATSLQRDQVTTPIISSTQNCNYSLRYCAATSLQATLATLVGGSCTVPEAVVTDFCTTDDGCG